MPNSSVRRFRPCAQAVGRSRSAASNLLRLLNLVEPVQQLLMAGDLDMGHARAAGRDRRLRRALSQSARPLSLTMEPPARTARNWALTVLLGAFVVVALGLVIFWGDLVSTVLDPKVPFQTYEPPPAPDYATNGAWYLRPNTADLRDADVFFVGPTTYDGGRNWNARINHPKASRQFQDVMAPNYVGPFV
eukprot:gene67493-92449_t